MKWTGWDLNPRPPTSPLPYNFDMQGRYSTRLNYRPTLLCPGYDNLSVLNMAATDTRSAQTYHKKI